MPRLTLALGEYDTGWHDVAGSLARAEALVRRAAGAGAELVVLPEMCTTGFTMDTAGHAEPRDGPSLEGLRAMARTHGVAIVAGVPIREHDRYFNMAFLIGADGEIAAEYRKQRVFQYAREGEHYDAGSCACTVTIHGVRVALLICFDLRFPELFRAVARSVDAVLLIANWPAARQRHWEVLVAARAIENQCYVAAVNRIGEGDGLHYAGGSTVIGPWGEPCTHGADGVLLGTIDAETVARVRREFPVLDAVR